MQIHSFLKICYADYVLLSYNSHNHCLSLQILFPMETGVLVKFFTAVGLAYVFLLGTLAGAIPHTIAVAGLGVAWFVGRRIGV